MKDWQREKNQVYAPHSKIIFFINFPKKYDVNHPLIKGWFILS